jgi:hypothetical protein
VPRLKGNSHSIRLGVRLLLVRQKKKERRGPVKKSDVDTDAEAKEGGRPRRRGLCPSPNRLLVGGGRQWRLGFSFSRRTAHRFF